MSDIHRLKAVLVMMQTGFKVHMRRSGKSISDSCLSSCSDVFCSISAPLPGWLLEERLKQKNLVPGLPGWERCVCCYLKHHEGGLPTHRVSGKGEGNVGKAVWDTGLVCNDR